jgi:Lrp/AsnC family transcriptional regulator, regulator for asnA, asnC and gidA
MVSKDTPWAKSPQFEPDDLDLEILTLLSEDGSVGYTELAKKIGVDKRTVAKHAEAMMKKGVLKIAAEIDWTMLGIGAHAFVGTQTEVGEAKDRLYEFIRREPRVVEAYSTVGSDEYFFVVLEEDLQGLREDVLRSLEPLTADLTTAIVSTRIKERDYGGFIEFIRNRRKTSKLAARTR